MKLQWFRSPKNNQFYLRMVGRNGKIVLQSEGYKRRRSVSTLVASISKAKFTGATQVPHTP